MPAGAKPNDESRRICAAPSGARSPMTTKRAASGSDGRPVRGFKNRAEFGAWLEKNHQKASGLWVRIGKKDSGLKSVTYLEALDTALCYGWIDGQKKPESEKAWLQLFVPRRPRSLWSKINREKALGLIESGQMKPPGLAEIERAKQDGRWDAAYDSPSRATVPADLQKELDRHPRAAEFFNTLDRTNRYAIIWRVQTATKEETRVSRIRTFIEMLERGEKLH